MELLCFVFLFLNLFIWTSKKVLEKFFHETLHLPNIFNNYQKSKIPHKTDLMVSFLYKSEVTGATVDCLNWRENRNNSLSFEQVSQLFFQFQ